MSTITVPPGYGYVLLVWVASVFLLTWMGTSVGGARKKYGVKYPTMYLPPSDPNADAFNWYD